MSNIMEAKRWKGGCLVPMIILKLQTTTILLSGEML
jgi:hypothetical protein